MTVSYQTPLKPVDLHLKAMPNCDIYVFGSFNDWNGHVKKMTDISGAGDYYITLMLPPGQYEYQFVVNGTPTADPECPLSIVNHYGTLNSVIMVT